MASAVPPNVRRMQRREAALRRPALPVSPRRRQRRYGFNVPDSRRHIQGGRATGVSRFQIRSRLQAPSHVRNLGGFEERFCIPVRAIDLRMCRGHKRHADCGHDKTGYRFHESYSTSDDQIIINILACKLALVTRAHDFLTSTDSAVFLRGARAFTLQHPPVQQVEDVTRIEDLPDLSDADLDRMRAIRDEARQKNGVTPPS